MPRDNRDCLVGRYDRGATRVERRPRQVGGKKRSLKYLAFATSHWHNDQYPEMCTSAVSESSMPASSPATQSVLPYPRQ